MKEVLEKYINIALDKLYENDMHLIRNRPYSTKTQDRYKHVGERSIMFRFAHYLALELETDNRFKGYHLDCEYNRNGNNKKKLSAFPDGTEPDIIVHKRGANNHNILVCELKPYWSTEDEQKKDIKKITGFIDTNEAYKFNYGLFLLIEDKRELTKLCWILPIEDTTIA